MDTLLSQQVAARLLQGPITDLHKINRRLQGMNLPPYYLGQAAFNIEYRIANTPRYIFQWWPPGLKMAEFYLYYMPWVGQGKEPSKKDEITIVL